MRYVTLRKQETPLRYMAAWVSATGCELEYIRQSRAGGPITTRLSLTAEECAQLCAALADEARAATEEGGVREEIEEGNHA